MFRQQADPARPAPSRSLLAASLLVLVAACGGSPGTVTPGVPSAPLPTPTAPTAVSLGVADIGRSQPAGTYRIAEPFGVPFTVTVPTAWSLGSLGPGKLDLATADGLSSIAIELIENVFADPCHSQSGPMEPPVASTVDAIVAAIADWPGFRTEPVSDPSIGGHAGKAFDLVNTIDSERDGCYDPQLLRLWTVRGGLEEFTVGGSKDRLWFVDVEGTPVLLAPGGAGSDLAASIQFEAPVAWTPPGPTEAPTGPRLSYVAIGDSLLFAAEQDCDGCTSAAVIYGAQMAADLGLPVDVHNLTMHNGLDSAMLRGYFERGARLGRVREDLFATVAAADVISLTIGFNDATTPDPSNIPALTKAFKASLDEILGHIIELRAGKPTAIRVTNVYNNGGPAWTAVVEAMNEVTCAVAEAHDAVCVDIYEPFNGSDGTGSPAALGYLGADATHPSQLGMEVIAAALVAAGYAPLD
jgi:lysophospholipase L1-like esterase